MKFKSKKMKLVKPVLAGLVATFLLGASAISASASLESFGRITFTIRDEPETSGPLRIDYVSNFDFGTIDFNGVDDVSTYAKPDTEIDSEGDTTNIPNFVQVTDERGENSGWELTVTQEGAFKTEKDRELRVYSIT